jgi:hypothetical protein
MIEGHFGMPWPDVVNAFAAQGAFLGFDAQTQGFVLLARGKDQATMEGLRDKFVSLIKLFDQQKRLEEAEYHGVRAFRLDEVRFASVNEWFVVTNKSDAGKKVLDRLIGNDLGSSTLASNPRFLAASETADDTQDVSLFIDVEAIRTLASELPVFRREPIHPVAEVFVGGIQSVVQKTPFLWVSSKVDAQKADIVARMPMDPSWVPDQRAYYFGESSNGRGPEFPQAREPLFRVSTYRDLSQVWLRAGDLFSERVNEEMAKADSQLTTLFSGHDFGAEILGSLTPEMSLVVTRQSFENVSPQPAIRLPAFALVLRLRDPEANRREFRRIFQSLVGFLNIVGAMEGNPQLEMNMVNLSQDAEVIEASYIPEAGKSNVTDAPIFYNFSPSVAFVGDRFIISSTSNLARELVAPSPGATNLSNYNTHGELEVITLRQLLQDNHQQLVSQNMIEKGHTQEEAKAETDLLIDLIGFVEQVRFELDHQAPWLEGRILVEVNSSASR